jgi:hypothetical protein
MLNIGCFTTMLYISAYSAAYVEVGWDSNNKICNQITPYRTIRPSEECNKIVHYKYLYVVNYQIYELLLQIVMKILNK